MTEKARLYELIDRRPENSSEPAERVLEILSADFPLEREAEAMRDLIESLYDPVLRTLNAAPEDDEPTTDEDRAAITQGWEDHRAGRGVSAEEAKRLLLS